MDILKKIGVDGRERRLIRNRYMEQNVKVRLEKVDTKMSDENRKKSQIGMLPVAVVILRV